MLLSVVDVYFNIYTIALVPILTRTRNDAPRCIRVLFMNRKTYDLRGLRFLHVDVSVRCCILQHVEINHKQG
jgi:hypothetical protein